MYLFNGTLQSNADIPRVRDLRYGHQPHKRSDDDDDDDELMMMMMTLILCY